MALNPPPLTRVTTVDQKLAWVVTGDDGSDGGLGADDDIQTVELQHMGWADADGWVRMVPITCTGVAGGC